MYILWNIYLQSAPVCNDEATILEHPIWHCCETTAVNTILVLCNLYDKMMCCRILNTKLFLWGRLYCPHVLVTTFYSLTILSTILYNSLANIICSHDSTQCCGWQYCLWWLFRYVLLSRRQLSAPRRILSGVSAADRRASGALLLERRVVVVVRCRCLLQTRLLDGQRVKQK